MSKLSFGGDLNLSHWAVTPY